MEKSRPKVRNKKAKKKTRDAQENDSVSDELHQAMQDIALPSEITKADDIPSTSTENVHDIVDDQIASDQEDDSDVQEIKTSPLEVEPEQEDIEVEDCSDIKENEEHPSTSTEILLNDQNEEQQLFSESNDCEISEDIDQTGNLYPELSTENSIIEVPATAPPLSIPGETTNLPQCNQINQENATLKLFLTSEVLNQNKPFTETQLAALYYNHEIDFAKEYIKEFIEGQKSLQTHKFYDILSTYLRSRNKLIATQIDVDNLSKECKEKQEHIWSIADTLVTESGKCQDGNLVSVSHKYPVATLNNQNLNSLSRTLSSVRDLANEVYTLHAYSSEVLRLQIEHYVQEVLNYYSNIPHNTPVQLLPSCNLQKKELCMCISILFMFQRRQIKDKQFISDVREWLVRMGATLLRVATASDHLFLLHHILRSPGGVTTWAIPLIQVPIENLSEPYPSISSSLLDHAVTFLYVLMSPIFERDQFIDDKRSLDDPWVFLDSDGDEEDEPRGLMALHENDLVAILNQIPIDALFRHVLGIQQCESKEIYYPENISQSNLLQLFSFATTIIHLIRTGLQTYNTPRYRQFAKRLGRLVRHTVQYVSEQWELYRNCSGDVYDPCMLARLQVEYDSLLFRATQCIFSSQRLGAWQFLSVVPYNVVSTNMLWCLFYLLHQEYQESFSCKDCYTTDWHTEIQRPELRNEFECKLSSIPEAEAYFLLNAFAAMALARELGDQEFILAVTLDLFQVGFVSEATRDSCSKTSRSLLINLVSKHPNLMSTLLEALQKNLQTVGSLSLYLVKELPLHLWYPSPTDMEIISDWLLSPPSTLQSSVVRCILAALDWPKIDIKLQLRVAMLVVEACLRHATERSGHTSPGGVAEGVSSLAAMVRNNSTPEQGLNTWSWGLLSRLRLHLNDRTFHVPLSEALHSIPDLESCDTLEILVRGVKEKEPIACFTALLATSWGHSVPLICTKGVPLLSILLSHAKYDALCETLHHILPLFIECPDSLTSCDKFLQLFNSLIIADRGYVKMAKNFLLSDSPGPVLRQVAHLIDSQFTSFGRYGSDSPHSLTELWLTLLTSLPDWTREPSVSYLLDVTLRASHLHPAAREVAVTKLRLLYRAGVTKQGGALSSILNWVALGSSTPSLLPKSSCPEYPWLALYVLDIEQDENEIKTGLWRQLLLELSDPSAKLTLDQALKRATNTLKVPSLATGSLAIYRWAQQALDTSVDHPLLPLFWQRFLTLFLARVPVPANVPDRGSVGSKFFEGMLNTSYLKKLRRRLYDASELYDARATESVVSGEGAEELGGDRRLLYVRTSRVLRTFSLWLEEGRLQEPNVYLPALPPQYDPNRLGRIFYGDTNPWMEFVDIQEFLEHQMDAVRDWQLQHFRSVELSLPMSMARKVEEPKSPLGKMMHRLKTYDKPQPAPQLKTSKPVVPFLAWEDLQDQEQSIASLKQQCSSLLEFAQVHALHTSELAALDCSLVELLPLLFRDTEVRVTLSAGCEAQARKKSNASECAGLFKVTIKVCESRLNEGTEHQVKQNRSEHSSLMSRSLQPPPQRVCAAAVQTENLVSKLVTEALSAKEREHHITASRLKDTGITLFYFLVSQYSEEMAYYAPTKQLLTSCIEMLGQFFVSRDEEQCEKLLAHIMLKPHLSGLLSPHFAPQLASTPAFIAMYKKVVDGCQANPDSSFVVLSKFDVPTWLTRRRPLLRERSQFIQTLGEALTASGKDPPKERLILHEKFLRHLCHILLHDFPEHYGEVLQLILKLSENQNLSLDVWWCLLDNITPQDLQKLRLSSPGANRDQFRMYATQQRLLGTQEIRDTASLLSTYFTKERLQYGLHGLYPKYRHYIEPLTVFLGMIGHSLVIATLHLGRGALGDTLSEQIWPTLMELYSPWLIPYTGQRLRQQSAAWIQQLSDDKAVLLPWTATDSNLAKYMSESFVDVIQFLLDTLPACSNILCFVWQFYITNYTLPAVKEHVLSLIHLSLSRLPWERFWPRGHDVDAMLKVADQYLPNSHAFMGSVFVQVSWIAWTQQVQSLCTVEHLTRSHICLMHLLIKLAAEPSVKQNPKCLPLLNECKKYLTWQLIDATAFDQVLNWFVMSCDPRVILPSLQDVHPVDIAVLEVLQEIAGYNPEVQQLHHTTTRKRLALIRAESKMLVSSSSRYKVLLSKNQSAFTLSTQKILDRIEAIGTPIVPVTQQAAEMALLLGELLGVTSVSAPLAAVMVPAICEWLQRRSGRSAVVRGLLRSLGVSVPDAKFLGLLLEETITAFFRDPGAPNITWLHALTLLQPVVPIPKSQQPWEPLEHTLVKEGHLLSLHALLLKRNPQEKAEQISMLGNLVEWLSIVKISETVEHKLPILWKIAFSLSVSICQKSVVEDGTLEETVVQKLNQLSQYLTCVGEDKGWGLLGVIGLRKQPQASTKLKMLARFLAAFLLVQMPSAGEGDKRCIRLTAEAPGALGNISSSILSETLEPPAPTSQALQAVSSLEALSTAKLNPPELKVTLDQALAAVRNPENSLASFGSVFYNILSQLYQDPFLTR